MNSILITVPSYVAIHITIVYFLRLDSAYTFLVAWISGQLVSMLALRYAK